VVVDAVVGEGLGMSRGEASEEMESEDARSNDDGAGVGRDAEIGGNEVCECAIETALLIEAECDLPQGELRSVKLEEGRIGGVGGRKMRLYSFELWRCRSVTLLASSINIWKEGSILLAGMQSTPSNKLEIDGSEHLR
jgi:hypothetical protein